MSDLDRTPAQLVETFEPHAEWTDDCQGKKDFDGSFLSISTRYWPGEASGEGPMIVNSTPGQPPKISTGSYGRHPSASASIHINHADGWEYTTLIEKKFEAPTEAEVKALVERWVRVTCRDMLRILVAHYSPEAQLGEDE